MILKRKKKDAAASAAVTEAMYQTILAPVITEKATRLSEYNKVVFKVALDADKTQIRQAVESLFNVKVTKVNTINVEGKNKVFKGRRGRRSDYKKAIVTLAAGQMLDVSTGLPA